MRSVVDRQAHGYSFTRKTSKNTAHTYVILHSISLWTLSTQKIDHFIAFSTSPKFGFVLLRVPPNPIVIWVRCGRQKKTPSYAKCKLSPVCSLTVMETIAQCGKIKPKFKQRKRVVKTRKRIDCTQPKCFALQWDYILVAGKSQNGGRIKSNKIAKMHFAFCCLAHIFVRGGETGTFS